jgi:dolichol-phosphate mannosyltransferase
VPELAIVIPTLNEAENIQPLVERLEDTLGGVDWEVVFVDDDSRDGTAELARRLALRNPRVRVLQRIGRTGLASASIEGMMSTAAPYIAVMDADLQHDESLLPAMLGKLKSSPDLDLVVASRNLQEGGMGSFPPGRRRLSGLGAKFSRLVCRCPITDPMSGFFLLRREFLQQVVRRLSGTGFKILVDILASSPRPARVGELPYRFRDRLHGASKLDINISFEYLLLIVEKLLGDVLPVRFALFVLVGAVGVVLNMAQLWVLYRLAGLNFTAALTISSGVAMIANYFLNNALTYRDLRLRGWHLVGGLATFCAACGVGALINISLANYCLERGVPWYAAGLIGLTIGAVWNYSATSVITWRTLLRRMQQADPAAEAARETGQAGH